MDVNATAIMAVLGNVVIVSNYSTSPLGGNTNITGFYAHEKDLGWEIFQLLCDTIIFCTGVTGNCLVLLTVYRDTAFRNLQHFLVSCLAVNDILTLTVLLPINITNMYISWPFGEFICRYIIPIGDVIPTVSILIMVSINVDRYRAIVHSMSETPSLKFGILLTIALWVICYLFVGIPLTLVLKVGPGHWVEKACGARWLNVPARDAYYTIRGIIHYVFPSAIIFYCYVRINNVLGGNLKFLERSISGKGQIVQVRRQRRVMTMFFAIFVTFVICMLPLNLFNVVFLYSKALQMWPHAGELFQITTLFALTNSCCNPIILYFLGRSYRVSFQKYLPILKWCHKRDEHVVTTCVTDNNNRSEPTEYLLFSTRRPSNLSFGRKCSHTSQESQILSKSNLHVSGHPVNGTSEPSGMYLTEFRASYAELKRSPSSNVDDVDTICNQFDKDSYNGDEGEKQKLVKNAV